MRKLSLIATILAAVILAAPALAGPVGRGGPYRVEITTDPAVIPVSRATLRLKVTDSAGKPVEGAQVRVLAQMPSMPMGEKETVAQPEPGKPGTYQAPAVFAMTGTYNATVHIQGSAGSATVVIPLATGQNTLEGTGGFSYGSLLTWLIAAALLAFVVYRMRKTGQRPNLRGVARPSTIGGILLLAAMFGISLYAIAHWRRPGAMTPIEAQAMEMNTPAPPGAAAVTLATVERGPIRSTVRYTGQAVGYNEQEVAPRVQGWVTWMPFYAGDRVKRGQIIARLDTSQQQPAVASREAAVAMARQGVEVARAEYRQALAEVRRANSEHAVAQGAEEEAESSLEAAHEDQTAAKADLVAVQSGVGDARAQVDSAKADQTYWQDEIARERSLLDRGAVSKEEYQREAAQAAAAVSKVQQAEAALARSQAQVQSAQAAVRKADAMARAAGNKVFEAHSEMTVHMAHVGVSNAAADAAHRRVAQAQAAVAEAQGALSAATTSTDYSVVRALIDGAVTQRYVSPGQLVNAGQPVVRVAQISPIRLQANVAESDLDRVQVGSPVTVHEQTDGGKNVTARVTSITPSVDPVARTGIVETVLPNHDSRFLPGEFVVMDISTGRAAGALSVPTQAIHTRTPDSGIVADRSVSYVWVASPVEGMDGQYTVQEADVRTGLSDRQQTEIVSGLNEGQQVVVTGGDYLKDGDTVLAPGAVSGAAGGAAPAPLMPNMPGMHGMTGAGGAAPKGTAASANTATVEISSKGFHPDSLTLAGGIPARITFIRKDEQNCATEIVLPAYGIRKSLPLNQPVEVDFTPRKGEFAFQCGMGMLKGKVVAR